MLQGLVGARGRSRDRPAGRAGFAKGRASGLRLKGRGGPGPASWPPQTVRERPVRGSLWLRGSVALLGAPFGSV